MFVVVAIVVTVLAFKTINADRQLAEAEAARLRAAQQILAQAGVPEPVREPPRKVRGSPRHGESPQPVTAVPAPPPGTSPPVTVAYTQGEDLPWFMTRPVTEDDLRGKSKWELDLMRNEIYARYGRTFARQDLQKYFASKNWYTPRYAPSQFPADRLITRVQQANIDAIQKYEQNTGR